MKSLLMFMLLFVFSLGLIACDASSDEPAVDEPGVEEIENVEEASEDVENEAETSEEGVSVPHMLGCPCCTSV